MWPAGSGKCTSTHVTCWWWRMHLHTCGHLTTGLTHHCFCVSHWELEIPFSAKEYKLTFRMSPILAVCDIWTYELNTACVHAVCYKFSALIGSFTTVSMQTGERPPSLCFQCMCAMHDATSLIPPKTFERDNFYTILPSSDGNLGMRPG